MTHLTAEELIDTLDGAPATPAASHLGLCGECRTRLDRLRATLDAARAVEVPEPSPLFWDHFSARVSQAIARDPESIHATSTPVATGLRWLGRPIRVGIVAVLLITVIAGIALRRSVVPMPSPDQTVEHSPPLLSSSPDASGADDSAEWALMLDVMEGTDWERLDEELHVGPGSAERVALELTPEEQHELARILQDELARLKAL
jgi:hypothetical protein